jgi:hypothetical protein
VVGLAVTRADDILGTRKVEVRVGLRRLTCPSHGVVVEAVPFARHRSGFSRDFEDVAAFLATNDLGVNSDVLM